MAYNLPLVMVGVDRGRAGEQQAHGKAPAGGRGSGLVAREKIATNSCKLKVVGGVLLNQPLKNGEVELLLYR